MAGRGVVSRLVCAVTPSLAAPTAMSSGRRHSFRHDSTAIDPREVSKQESLGDRASSKLTLDDELFDILCAFGETETFLGAKDTKDETEEEGKPLTRQALLERIREKKEVIGKLRCQGWSMARKRRTLKLAQKYLEQHESKVSKSHLYMEELRKRGRLIKRHFSNFKTYLIPWEGKIKKIESHFGSVVSSYFTFLRWIVFVNVIITLIIFTFVVLPESVADASADDGRRNRTETRKKIPLNEKIHADEIAVVWHYDGYVRYSPLFYGYYSDDDFVSPSFRYAVPLAYFLTTIFIFAYSFFAILRKIAMNARMSKISGSKTEQYIFNWRVFTGWDYTIGNSETAANTVMAVVIKLRESIADIKVDAVSKFRCLQFTLRVIANITIIGMLAFSIYCITVAVQKSQTAVEQEGNLFTKNQVPSVVATITHLFPMIFDLIGRMENYHPRTALRVHLGRVLILYVVNYITLILALFEKMDSIRKPAQGPRTKRQMGDRNPNIPRPPPFASRQFADQREYLSFAERANRRFDVYRTTRQAPSTPVTITPQYGPLNVNNPQVLLRNGSFTRTFESKRIGPAPLPIFTPPPRPPKPYETGTVRQQFGGPDFPTPRTYTRVTAPPRVRTLPPWQRNTEEPPATITQQIQEETSSYEDYTDQSPSGSSASPHDINDSLSLPEPALRKSSVDEVGGPDICWETIIGQEIVKLVTMDLIVTIVSILLIDFLRGLWIRHCASWWCWDIETTFPEYGEFKVAENVLHIINNQGMIWLGLFFAPLLPALNNIKLIILMYIRGWAVMTCNVPAREIFRASRSSNFYLLILLFWLLLCTIPVGFVIASRKPSGSCGPFAHYEHFYTVVTQEIEKRFDQRILSWMKNIASPGIVIPILLFLVLIIYFLVSLVRGLREANTDLQQQLIHERTEEKKKIFELAGGGKRKQEENRDRMKKTTAQYLPFVEQKRRETWRAYHELEEEPQGPSDSSSSEDEDGSDESPDMVMRTLPPVSTTAETIYQMQPGFHPSLASLVENEGEEEEVLVKNNSSNQSRTLFDSPVDNNVVDIATPEEIRSILRPLLEMKYGVSSSKGYQGFPRDLGTPPTMIVSSRSKRNSFISLYDLANMDNHIPTMMSTQVLRGEERAEVHRNGDAERRKQAKVISPTQQPPKVEDNGKNGNKFDSGGIKPDFQPWPSIDEVKQRKEQLLKRTPLALNKPLPVTTIGQVPESPLEGKPPIPIHRKYQQYPEGATSASETDGERSISPTRRFRISVSPTRKLTSEEREGSSQKRIYSIKQESATASTASLPRRDSDGPTSPRAPRVEFGDDDSPRVQ